MLGLPYRVKAWHRNPSQSPSRLAAETIRQSIGAILGATLRC